MNKREQMRACVREMNNELGPDRTYYLNLHTSGMSASVLSLPLWAIKIHENDKAEPKIIPWLDQVTCAELLERGDALLMFPQVLTEVVENARAGIVNEKEAITLPDYVDVNNKLYGSGELDPIESFVYDYEPNGIDRVKFRENLRRLIEYVKNS